jgi:SpoVK/Ycf46/Vps4 family AAA+-type ATPase
MFQDSRHHLFALISRIHRRAEELVGGERRSAPACDAGEEGATLTASIELRLPRLAETFSLSPLAVRALVCLLAAEYDPFIRLLQRAVQRDTGRPWLELGTIAELLQLQPMDLPDLVQLFDAGGELRRHALVLVDDVDGQVPTVALRTKVTTRIARHLAGIDTLPQTLNLVTPSEDPGRLPLPVETVEQVAARVRRALLAGQPLVVEIAGPAGCGKKTFAEAVAGSLGRPLLLLDLQAVERDRLELALAEGQRDAELCGALLCLSHLEVLVPPPHGPALEDASAPPPALRALPPALRRMLVQLQGTLLITVAEREPLVERAARTVMTVAVPFPSPSQRAELLEREMARRGSLRESAVDLSALGRRFALDPRRIEQAVHQAAQLAADRGPDAAVSAADLTQACRAQLHHELTSVATRVTTHHRWEDLVIPVEVYDGLKEMIAYARHAERVYDAWGFAGRHSLPQGLSALFAGPPGTGKTMCAGVMARELDMELFQVDLSRVVSKWIGETEKNLGRIFDEAQRSNAIVLFDEADSLFSKRTEVKSSHDRYANLEVNFLLQRIEAFSGVTILTTNFEDSIDMAFRRRLTFRLRFDRPDAEARASLWDKTFPDKCQLGPDVSPERLGELYEMSGANIRNAALRAAFLAAARDQPVSMEMCMEAAERECRELGLLVRSRPEQMEPGPPGPLPAVRRPPARLIDISHPRNR